MDDFTFPPIEYIGDFDRTEGKRSHIYRGVKLNAKAQVYIDEQFMDDGEVF